MLNDDKIIRETILQQLSYGVCSRSHLHRECCVALGKSIKKTNARFCEGISDNQFDKQFNLLIEEGYVQKTPYYEITDKGKQKINASLL